MSIALTFIATGDYIAYVPGLIASARRHFARDHKIVFWCFSDSEPPRMSNVRWRRIQHEPWPGPTLHRYRHLATAIDSLASYDYVFHCDADARFVQTVNGQVLGNLVAVLHPGHADGKQLPHERREQSTACTDAGERRFYFAGGFQGGTSAAYLKAVVSLEEMVDIDESQGVTAVWHDESHWNRYLIDFPPDVILPRSFLACESLPTPETKFLSLLKPEIVIHGQSARTR